MNCLSVHLHIEWQLKNQGVEQFIKILILGEYWLLATEQ